MNKLSLKQKISAGFGIILVLLIIISIISSLGLSGVVGDAKEVISGNTLTRDLTQRHLEHLQWAGQVADFLNDESITEMTVQKDPHKCAFGKWYYGEGRKEAEKQVPSLKTYLQQIEKHHTQLHNSAKLIEEKHKNLKSGILYELAKVESAHLEWLHTLSRAILTRDTRNNPLEFDPKKCAFAKWLQGFDSDKLDPNVKTMISAVHKPHARLHESGKAIYNYINTGNYAAAASTYNSITVPSGKETINKIREIYSHFKELEDSSREAQEIYNTQTTPALHNVGELLHKMIQTSRESILSEEVMLSTANATRMTVIIIGLISIILGSAMAWFIAQGISKATLAVVSGLKESSGQVQSASAQLAETSQNLAEGASEQASSLEETSASLSDVNRRVQENTENSLESERQLKTVESSTNSCLSAMIKLSESINHVRKSSSDTARIINDIDEIALQTNLLALNAAVEAARAGEAGAGFAVVAEEVRGLAQRSAEAAQDTANLIRTSQKQVDESTKITGEVDQLLKGVSEAIEKMGVLVTKVSHASQEQKHEIEQVSGAVTQMETVTQGTAANAEESASASEELSAQAEVLDNLVETLNRLVKGSDA